MAVTIDDLKEHARILSTDEHPDSVLTRKLAVATAMIEARVNGFAKFDGDIPAPIEEAILQLAAHLLENREATTFGGQAYALPYGVDFLISPWASPVPMALR